MPTIPRSDQARLDLIQILLDFRRRSPKAADRLEAEIEKKCQLLAPFPEMGRAREDLAPGLRSFTAGKSVIFYRPIAGGIEVVRIVHGSRDVSGLFP